MMPTTVFDRSGGTDPVCKRTVREADGLTALYRGRTYRFCCPGCKREFELNPKLYARTPATGPARSSGKTPVEPLY